MPRPCLWEFTCDECGDSFVRQGTVDDVDEFGYRCMKCAFNGIVAYYSRYRR